MMDQQSSVGIRLLEVRRSRGLSLRALAASSGLSINAISRIEREESSPTVASLQRLASALDVPLIQLFRVAPECATVVVRHGEGLKSRSGGVLIESLGAGLRGQRSGPFLMTLEPGASGGEESIHHEGEEFVHCLEGEVEYTVGTGRHHLAEGDSLLFLATQPHTCRNLVDRAARLLIVVVAPPGDMQATQQRHLMLWET
ncbi:MAG: cupin domain-containing protein [Gemmatimonadetes bacterium]|nr:cupin domain-containing protein [Gemmatimonadota bacterium]